MSLHHTLSNIFTCPVVLRTNDASSLGFLLLRHPSPVPWVMYQDTRACHQILSGSLAYFGVIDKIWLSRLILNWDQRHSSHYPQVLHVCLQQCSEKLIDVYWLCVTMFHLQTRRWAIVSILEVIFKESFLYACTSSTEVLPLWHFWRDLCKGAVNRPLPPKFPVRRKEVAGHIQ